MFFYNKKKNRRRRKERKIRIKLEETKDISFGLQDKRDLLVPFCFCAEPQYIVFTSLTSEHKRNTPQREARRSINGKMQRRQPDPTLCADITQFPVVTGPLRHSAASVPRVELGINEPPLPDLPRASPALLSLSTASCVHPKHVPPEQQRCTLEAIPAEVLAVCFEYLPATDVLDLARRTCRAWYSVTMRNPMFRDYGNMCGVHVLGGVSHSISPLVAAGQAVVTSQPVSLTFGTPEWTPRLPALKQERIHCAAAVVDRRIYVVGGRAVNDRLNTVEMFDPATKKWSLLPPMPQARSAATAVGLAGKLWVFGGTDGAVDVAEVAVFDPSSSSWSQTAVPDLPEPASEIAAVAYQHYIIVIGGRLRDGTTLADVRCLDVTSGVWSVCPSMCTARACPAVGVVGTTLWVAGGSDSAKKPLASTECIDLANMHASWLVGPNMTTPRSNPTGAVVRGRFQVLCGFYFGPLRSVETLCPSTRRWVKGKEVPRKFDAAKVVVWDR
jgi:hypothetical protein